MTAHRTAVATCAFLLVGLVGCGDDGPDSSAATTTRAPATTTSTTRADDATTTTATTGVTAGTAPAAGSPTTTAKATTPADPVPDGANFGYVTAVSVSGSTITIDIAELLTGDAAVKAAIEDGAVEPGATSIDNDYYIRNKNPKVRTATVAPGAPIKVLDNPGNPDLVDGNLEKLGAHLAVYGDGGVPVRITASGGTVTQLEEVFFP